MKSAALTRAGHATQMAGGTDSQQGEVRVVVLLLLLLLLEVTRWSSSVQRTSGSVV